MKVFTHAELVMKDHYLPDMALFEEDGKIAALEPMKTAKLPAGTKVIDVGGAYLAPGLIDIHVHAGDFVRFSQDPVHAAKAHLEHGVTTVFATYSYDKDLQRYLDAIDLGRKFMRTPEAPNLYGIYMEGPYTNPKYGANAQLNPWTGPIVMEEAQELIDRCGDAVYVWAIAPEREYIEDFVKAAKKRNPNVLFAVGHSEASPEQIEKLMPYGLKIGTHHTNATGDLVKFGGCRGVCVDETVNRNHEIYAEMISDSLGIHVNPYMQRLIRQIKGDDRLILISDQSNRTGPIPAGYEGVTDLCFDHFGGISGSRLTLDVACRNVMRHTGASVAEAVRFASYNPAQALHLTDRGEIAVGKRADLIITDDHMNLQGVFLAGERR